MASCHGKKRGKNQLLGVLKVWAYRYTTDSFDRTFEFGLKGKLWN